MVSLLQLEHYCMTSPGVTDGCGYIDQGVPFTNMFNFNPSKDE